MSVSCSLLILQLGADPMQVHVPVWPRLINPPSSIRQKEVPPPDSKFIQIRLFSSFFHNPCKPWVFFIMFNHVSSFKAVKAVGFHVAQPCAAAVGFASLEAAVARPPPHHDPGWGVTGCFFFFFFYLRITVGLPKHQRCSNLFFKCFLFFYLRKKSEVFYQTQKN